MGNDKQLGQITLFSETDSYGKIVFVNEAFCEVAKYSKEELLGKPQFHSPSWLTIFLKFRLRAKVKVEGLMTNKF